jgi:hypothetical protein
MATNSKIVAKSAFPMTDCTGTGQAFEQALAEIASRGPPTPAGIMVWWTGAVADIPSGWALMNGVANATGNGGSGYSLVDKFVLAAASGAGTAAGGGRTSRESHSHDVMIEEDYVGVRGDIDNMTTGVEVGQSIYSSTYSDDVYAGEALAVAADPHTHMASVSGGDHDHEIGNPAHMKLIPIEKLIYLVT